MTTPIQHDYPDWGRQAASSDIIVAQHINENLAGPVTDPVKFVGQYNYVHVRAFSIPTSVSIELQWFIDEAATVGVQPDIVQTLGPVDAIGAFPVRAPFLKVINRLAAYPNTFTNIVHMTSAPSSPISGVAGDNSLISAITGGPLAAGGNVTLTAKGSRPGSAYFEADLIGGADFQAYLYATDYLGVQTALASCSSVGGVRSNDGGKSVYLPAQTCQIQIFNSTAAAHQYRALLHHQIVPI